MGYDQYMPTTYTIGQLTEQTAVPASTLRYYERIGLLTPSRRSRSNYRLYSEDDLSRLSFIKLAQTTGFTLDDIRLLLGLERGTTESCDEVVGVIQLRLEDVAQRMRDFRRIQKLLKSALDLCTNCDDAGQCLLIKQFAEAAPQKI